MIKKLHFKTMLLLCTMIMGIGSAWAETKSVDITPSQALNDGGVDPIIIVCEKGDGTSNPAISSGQLRLYQAASGKTTGNTITFSSEKTITSIVFTFANEMTADNGVFSEGEYDSSTSTWTGSTNSVTLTVTGTTSGKRIYISAMTVYYDDSGSQLANSDFALTGAPVALTFDLYDNADAQTISYTSSSTGAVTVAASEYVETVVNETAKTITVTPKKKSGEAQTITVSQAADNTYKAGSATFTVTIADSTPTTGSWVLTDLADLVEGDVFVIVGNNGDTYAMSNDKGTGSAPTAVAVTVEDDEISGTVDDNIKWNISGNANDGYTFYPNGSTETWLYCTNTNNGVRVGKNDNKTFVIDSDYLKHSGTSRYVGIYDSQDWRCYTSINSNIANQTFAFYKYVSGGVLPPSIIAGNVEIAYNAESGSIAYTLKNGVEGGVLRATTTADWLTIGTVGETIPFTCDANTETTERTATVTLTYTYGNENVTKDVTVTQAAAPVVYATIPALFEAATSTATDVNVTFDNWVVSGVSTNGKNVFVTDGANGFVIFDSNGGLNNTYAVGNILSGTAVSCKLVLYNGFAEITNLNASDLTITAGGTVSEADIDMADLTGVNTGALVSYENLTCSVDNNKYYLSDGTTTLQVYNALYAFEALEDGKTYNITGVYQQYNSTKEILPRSANDIVKVAAQHNDYDLTITLNDNVSAIFVFDATDENNPLIVDGAAGTVQVTDGTEILVSPDVEAGYQLASLMVDGVDVTSQIDVSGAYTFTMPAHNVTVSATAVAPEETIGSFVKVTSTDEITSGQYLIVYEEGSVAFDGSRDDSDNNKLDAVSNTIGVTIENGMIAATTNNITSVFNIDVTAGTLQSASGLYIGVSSNSNGLKTSEDATKYTNSFSIDEDENAVIAAVFDESTMTLRFNKASNQDRFRYYKDNGQQAIQLYKFVADADDVEVTVTSAGYATYCSENALDFSDTGLTAYKAILDGSEVSFTEVKQVPAGEGVLLKGDAGTYSVPVAASAAALTGNAFIGVIEETLVSEPGIFVLMNEEEGVGFYKTLNAFTVGAHTAYLPALSDGSRSFIGLNETTGISDVNRETITNNRYFDLQGRSVAQPTKGLYIVNGKKVVVK